MQLTKVQTMIGVTLGAISLLGAVASAVNYYEPRTRSDAAHAEIRAYVADELAATKSWSELESINHKIAALEMQILRIVDLANLQNRGLTQQEQNQIDSLRDEIRFHNDRKNQILARQ